MAALIRAATAEFAAKGYAGATMSGIAERAGTAIGSLYQFFPNKESIARAVRTSHVEDVERALAAPRLDGVSGFVGWFVGAMIEFVHTHPAFLPLQDAPSSTRPHGPRNRVRRRMAEMIAGVAPGVSEETSARLAECVFQVNRAMMALYAGARREDRDWIAAEYRRMLECYLHGALRESITEGSGAARGTTRPARSRSRGAAARPRRA